MLSSISPGTPSNISTTCADFSPVAPLVRMDNGTLIVPPAGISLPSMSTVVHVQLGALRTHFTGRSRVFRSVASNFTSVCGATKPASSDAGIALIGHSAICSATCRARSAICCCCGAACVIRAHAMAMTVAAQETKRGQAGRAVNFMGFPLVHRSSARPTLEPHARY